MESENKQASIEDIQNLLQQNGASRDIKAQIQIYDYQNLIPDNQSMNKLQKIGQGAYGNVYVIKLKGINHALKIMTQQTGKSQQDLINEFYQECRSLLSVNHEKVLRIIGVAMDTRVQGRYVFCHITNYQALGSLYSLINIQKALFQEDKDNQQKRFINKLKLLGQIAEGIQAIHGRDLVHRDIKSPNILMGDNYTPKIADLGIATDENITHSVYGKGSPWWMAPELYDYKVSKKVDIWSLACVAVEIFNENVPYPQLASKEAVKQHVYVNKKFPVFSQEINQDLQLVQLLERCFKYNPKERYTIEEFKVELESIIEKQKKLQINPIQSQNIRMISQDQINLSQPQSQQQFYTDQNLKFTELNSVPNVYQYNPISFIRDANTVIWAGINYQETSLSNTQIKMDEQSSVYYTKDYIYISGGKLDGNCSRNFQMINRKELKIEKECLMLKPRNGHGMVEKNQKDGNVFVYIISGNIEPWEDEKTCEYFDQNQGQCKE